MITIKHGTTRYTVTEANAPMYRALIDADKPPKFKKATDRKHDSTRRDYPEFYAGMKTAEYISRYESLNNRLYLSAAQFTHADRAAPTLDATQPEVLEELDADYIAPAPVKKKATPAQIRAAALELIETLEGLAIHPSHYAKLKGML